MIARAFAASLSCAFWVLSSHAQDDPWHHIPAGENIASALVEGEEVLDEHVLCRQKASGEQAGETIVSASVEGKEMPDQRTCLARAGGIRRTGTSRSLSIAPRPEFLAVHSAESVNGNLNCELLLNVLCHHTWSSWSTYQTADQTSNLIPYSTSSTL
ncbi:hypothetical protein OBBRIDRAFT_825273 [Obba rivulosa]|uniref:Uncharacterized protein n=1 Tax=Obba rivulosa TaxID=1052685 RepID=A0A8E2B0N8_9APHY|nr:hypothetical protein OBBRIDRAFT_825273 [Obba rivulosa]